MQGTGHLRLLPEQHAQMLQLPIILRQHTGCQRRAIGASVIRGFTVADIDAAVLRKIGIQRNVQQSALPGGCHARQPVHRRHDLPTARDAPQCATALGHQKTALGQKGQPPGVVQMIGHRHPCPLLWTVHRVGTLGRKRLRARHDAICPGLFRRLHDRAGSFGTLYELNR